MIHRLKDIYHNRPERGKSKIVTIMILFIVAGISYSANGSSTVLLPL